MPENDDILGSGDAGAGHSEKQNSSGTGNPPPSVDPAVVTRAVREAMGDLPGEMRQYTQAITRYVDERLGGAAGPQGGGKSDGVPASVDLTQQLLSDPKAAIGSVLDEWARTNLAPYFTTKINDDFESLLDGQRTRIDSQWGAGAFDALIAKDVVDTANKTPNAAARGSKEYVAALVRGRVGHEDVLPKLQAHKAEYDKAHKDDNMGDGGAFLDAGRRRPRNDSPFSEGDEEFIAHYAAVTGIDMDKKLLGEALKVRNRDGVWDTQNFPGVKNKLSVKAPRGKNFNAGRS